MNKGGAEFKVGIFVVVGLAVLTLLVFKSGDFHSKPGYLLRIVFDTVSGIEPGSSVKLAGVDVGEVKRIRVVRNAQGQTQAEVSIRIDQGVYVEEDAIPRISSMGVLGDKYVELLPGTTGAKAIVDGGSLEGHEPSNMDDLVNSGQRLIGKVETTFENLNQVVADPEFKVHLKGTFVNMDKVAVDLSEAASDLKDTMKSAKIVMARLRDGEGTVGRLLKDDTIAKDMEAFVADLKAHPWKLLKKN